MCHFDKDLVFYKATILGRCEVTAVGSRGVNKYRYYIHYCGWNKKWDEWVNSENVLPLDEEKM